MRSLESKFRLWIGLTIATILIGAGLIFYLSVRSALLTQFDTSLEQSSWTFANLIETDGNRIESEMAEKDFPQFTRANNPDYYQIFDSSGQSIESSSKLADHSLPHTHLLSQSTRFEFLTLPDGRPGRIASFQFVPRLEMLHETGELPDEDEKHNQPGYSDSNSAIFAAINPGQTKTNSTLTLVIARDMIQLNQSLSRIRWLSGVITTLAIFFGLLSATLVARWGLRPLRKTAHEIARIDDRHFDVRLDPQQAPSEVESTLVAINQMLDRLKNSFQRERNFSANVAHEIRTPLAGLKSTIEVALTRKRDSAEYETTLDKCLKICAQTESMVENLFTLARLDEGEIPVRNETIDLDQTISDAWQPFIALAAGRGLMISRGSHSPIRTKSDPEKLRLVFRNLFDNAITYADRDSTIQVCCEQNASIASIRIANHASSFQPSDLEHLFDRFWRADTSRSQTGEHSGLGLPLCRSLIELLGGSIQGQLVEPSQFVIQVDLPIR